MGKAHEAILQMLTDEAETRPEWDEPPALFTLYREPVPHLSKIPFPDIIWDDAITGKRVPDVLHMLGQILQADRDELPGLEAAQRIHGVAFRHEGWGLMDTVPGTAEMSEAAITSRKHQIHRHPDRVEVRMLIAVDRAGITYSVIQHRGGKTMRNIQYPGSREYEMAGAIVEGLDLILSAITGIEPMPRRPT